METSNDNKIKIIEQLYMFHEDDKDLKEFFDFYNSTLWLSIAVSAGLVTGLTERGVQRISEAFDELLRLLDIEDTGFESLYDFWENDE